MKKLILTTCFSILCVLIAFAQPMKGGVTWFDAGLKIQYGASGLFNQALADSDAYNYDLGLTTGLSFGGRLGFNYDNHGVALEFMLGKGEQPFEDQTDNSTFTVDWKTNDLYLLYRNNANKGYFEIGPKYSLVSKVNIVDGSETFDITEDFQNYFSGVIGFGSYLIGNDGAFSGLLGLRAEYGFSDAVTAAGRANGSPVGNPSVYATNESSTNIIFAGLVFELNWGIGYYAKAGCGQRSKFIKF